MFEQVIVSIVWFSFLAFLMKQTILITHKFSLCNAIRFSLETGLSTGRSTTKLLRSHATRLRSLKFDLILEGEEWWRARRMKRGGQKQKELKRKGKRKMILKEDRRETEFQSKVLLILIVLPLLGYFKRFLFVGLKKHWNFLSDSTQQRNLKFKKSAHLTDKKREDYNAVKPPQYPWTTLIETVERTKIKYCA